MSISCNKNNAPRNGTNRLNRLPKALDANFVAIDERDKDALYAFCEKLSSYINYYYFDGVEQIGDWQTVFKKDKIRNDGLTEPHLALFDAFLDLYAVAQKDLNQFTAKHLDYFYETVLGFEKKAAQPDKVYLTVELAKHITQYILDSDIEFKAGKNTDKKQQFYKLLSNFSFSHAKVAELKSVLVDKEDKSLLYSSPVANSGDGLGGNLVNLDRSWDTFGNVNRPKAKVGFAISSPLFRMSGGTRKVSLTVTFKAANPSGIISLSDFKASATSEKGWIDIHIISMAFASSVLKIELEIDETKSKIVNYSPVLHVEPYQTKFPVIKIEVLKTSSNQIYNNLNFAAVGTIKIDTNVVGVKNVIVQNSLGKLDASKPMQIFGSSPTVGVNFYIGNAEVFQHKPDSVEVNFEFLNLPTISFDKYYKLYADPSAFSNVLPGAYVIENDDVKYVAKALLLEKDQASKESDSLVESAQKYVYKKYSQVKEIVDLFNNYVKNTTFTVETSYLYHRRWLQANPVSLKLFGESDTSKPETNFSKLINPPTGFIPDYDTNAGDGYDLEMERGYLKLKFASGTFGHADYQQAYSRAILNNLDDPKSIELPNPPYTPLIQNLSLNYKCSATINLAVENNALNDYHNRVNAFFHIDAFGVAELHPYKQQEPVLLLPLRENEAELYIGLSNAVAPQMVSLLFKVSEGSADPETNKAIVKWSYLEENNWRTFKSVDILREQTNGLLTTGIVTLNLPKTVNSDNTLLPSGFIWLKAAVAENSLAICDIIAIDAQACEAEFKIYEDVLPEKTAIEAETISKLKDADAAVKKITQPYASFDGKAKEGGNEYYLRVSERLRHKNRAITLWDYERLILAQFPNVYTAKCINHTFYNGSVNSYNSLSPGSVTIIAVPDVTVDNAPNPLQPKVSKNTLEEIKAFLQKHNSVFARLNVQNPIFEEIKLDFHVKLRNGYETNIYIPKLKEQIMALLAPWTTNNDVQLELGGKIEKSTIIYQLEKLSYVDYITCFKMFLYRPPGLEQISNRDIERAEAATAASVLTSYPDHTILNISEIPGVANPDCDCADCDDNIVKTTGEITAGNECGCK